MNWTPERIKALRKLHLKMTQDEFADMLGLKRRATISELEKEENPRKVSKRMKTMLDMIAKTSDFTIEPGKQTDLEKAIEEQPERVAA